MNDGGSFLRPAERLRRLLQLTSMSPLQKVTSWKYCELHHY